MRIQRQRQQGLGKPIVSAEVQGKRVVAVNNRLLHSGKWRTFHDFLVDYIKIAMGEDWGNAELAKPLEQRHPILLWYDHLCKQQWRYIQERGKVYPAPLSGAVGAYMHLAYDLYALDHNAELQEKLVGRLRDPDNFVGARYEVFVAATLIRAGFEIEFENEDDRSTSHCEFTATFKRTGRKFSVEAKRRASDRFRLGRQLNRALAKRADHTRILFIDINVPDLAREATVPEQLDAAITSLRAFEGRQINGGQLPEAYIVVTNNPCHHHLEIEGVRCSAVGEGFQISDFKADGAFPNLRAAINARERHIEMHELLNSMRDHAEIPSTFDGEIPEFAFGEGEPRLFIGRKYIVNDDKDGKEHIALLTTATVMEPERKAYCGVTYEDSTSHLVTWELSDEEMAAWRKFPDTFFGEVGQRNTKAESPLELYDFFLGAYRKTSKERLLEFMATANDIEVLKKLDQPSLASVYAERLVNGVLATKRNAG
jgi:hypothetical protein